MTDQKDLDECLSKIIENAENDRELADNLLSELTSEIKESKKNNDFDKHERAGNTANKYLQSIQRANDQLIKVAKIIRDDKQVEDVGSFDFGEFDFDDEEEVVLEQNSSEEE